MARAPIKDSKPWLEDDLATLKRAIHLNGDLEVLAILLDRSAYDVHTKASELILAAVRRASTF